jgi:hypothetical protein
LLVEGGRGCRGGLRLVGWGVLAVVAVADEDELRELEKVGEEDGRK